MAEDISVKIFNAIKEIQGSNDPEVFVKKLLKDTLNWPIEIDELEEFDFDDLGYDWNTELEAMGLRSDEGIQDLFQIAKFPGWPLGMFVVRFGSNSIFTKGRGMTTPLRNLLRNLFEKVRPTASHQTWSQDQLLFICHHEHEYFQFARFSDVGSGKLPKLQTFGWGPNDHIRTLCEYNLKFLEYKPNMNSEEAIQQVEMAFDISKLSKRFYNEYKEKFSNAIKILCTSYPTTDVEAVYSFIQQTFNRLLFLRFLEKKGWLIFNKSESYMKAIFEHSVQTDSESFYTSRYRKLMFEGLTVNGKQTDPAFGTVPYLSGGLFQENNIDRIFSDIPNSLFSDLIGEDGLLYRYNFTVSESTPLNQNVAVDPEMLGTIFEELVTERNDKGAFYTPKSVVSYMTSEAILRYLLENTSTNEKILRGFVFDESTHELTPTQVDMIYSELNSLTAIDPACGSGAYLVGLMENLVRLHGLIHDYSSSYFEDVNSLKSRLIANCIFGVDKDKNATEIAKLRLWLSLMVDSDEPLPLPNLDFNIYSGDSILAPNPKSYQLNLYNSNILNKADALALRKRDYVSLTGPKINQQKNMIQKEENDLINEFHGTTTEKNSVDFRIQFAQVFSQNGGFDIVLANPPYLRHEKIKSIKPKLKSKYKSYTGTADLLVYFFERGLQLCKRGGIIAYITSNKFMKANYGEKIRNELSRNLELYRIIDFGDAQVFENAIAYPCITIGKYIEVDNENCVTALSWQPHHSLQSIHSAVIDDSIIMKQIDLQQSDVWKIISKADFDIFNKLEKIKHNLSSAHNISINFGLKTGLNKAFLISEDKKDELIKIDQKSAAVIQPVIKGKDIQRWAVKESSNFMIVIPSSGNTKHPWSNKSTAQAEAIFRKTYPAVFAHLHTFKPELEKRGDKGEYYWELRSCTYYDKIESPKILYSDISIDPSFLVDSSGLYCLNTCYFLDSGSEWICAILNSSLSKFYFSKSNNMVRGGFIRFFKQYVEKFPIPVLDSKARDDLTKLAIAAKATTGKDREGVEAEIDRLVFNLYHLNQNEAKHVRNQ